MLRTFEEIQKETQDFTQWLQINNKSHNTIQSYTLYLTKLLQNCQTKELTQENINEFYLNKKNNHSVGRAMLKKYLKFKKIPLSEIEMPEPSRRRKRNTQKRYLTEQETIQLVQALRNEEKEQYALGVIIIFQTGLRISELLKLTPKHFNFETYQVKGKGKGEVKYELDIDEETNELILEYLKKKKLKVDDLIFKGNRKQWSSMLLRAGMKHLNQPITAHWIRHSCLTDFVEKGATIQEAQAYARHVNVETTLRYLHNLDTKKLHEKRRKTFEINTGEELNE